VDITLTNGSQVIPGSGVLLLSNSTGNRVTNLTGDGSVNLQGDVLVQSHSSIVKVALLNNSILTGAMQDVNDVTVQTSSTWDMTNSSTVNGNVLISSLGTLMFDSAKIWIIALRRSKGINGIVSPLPTVPTTGKETVFQKDGKTVSQPPVFQPGPQNRWGVWVNGWGDFVSVDDDNFAKGYHFTTGGGSVGIDYRITDSLAVGIFGKLRPYLDRPESWRRGCQYRPRGPLRHLLE
jgi:autotransporter-like protein